MKTQELRIGNYIYKKIHKKDTSLEVIEVLSINSSFDVLDVKNIGGYITEQCPLKDFEPIPLTEEWLLKFGFTRHHADYSNEVIYIKNIPDNNEFEWGAYPNELGSGIQIKNRKLLKYVHQLQGLYFYLTGEELTIK